MTEKEAQRLVKQAGQGQTVPPARKSGAKPDGVTSDGEEAFVYFYGVLKPSFPMPRRQYPILPWSIDFALPEQNILIEIEGVGHRLSPRYEKDIRKYNQLAADGWKLFRVTAKMLNNDPAPFFALIEQAYTQARLAKVGTAAVQRLRKEHGTMRPETLTEMAGSIEAEGREG